MAASWVCFTALLLLLGPSGWLQAHCETYGPAIIEEVVKKVDVTPLGGWRPIPLNGKTAQEMAQFAEAAYKGGSFRYHTVKILSAEMQVVYGFNYRLIVEMVKTRCRVGQPLTEVCSQPDPSNTEVLRCDIWIYVEPQTDKKTLSSQTCKPRR